MQIREKIDILRKHMKENNLKAYIIPSSDAHQSEYVAEYWKSRQWTSGFTGSAGTLVITLDYAGLWTDGRYFIQAERQLEGSEIKLFKMAQPKVPTYTEWLCNSLSKGDTVGIDGRVFSISSFEDMEKQLNKKGIELKVVGDLIDTIWKDRPSIPKEKIFDHLVKYAGKSRKDKLDDIRKNMKINEAEYYVLSSLDDIAWLFNIRGNDVPNNPVVTSYALIALDYAYIFIDKDKVPESMVKELAIDSIEFKDYNSIDSILKDLKSTTIMLDPDKTNVWLYKSIDTSVKIVRELNLTTKLKAVKNEIEIHNLNKCQQKDGVAMVKFIKWLKDEVTNGKITEISATEKLESFRKEQEFFIEPSFDTIAAYKENAAMMHYKANENSNAELKPEGFFLVDSGGQYLDGTTDITRTIVLGKLTEKEKEDFTLVLKSHIGLAKAVFLEGATGSNIDILARRPLWERGIDYKCGTGHGVGFLLNVHEGPQRFSQVPNTIKLEPGMIITNEPGIYREGEHGIRTENTLLVKEKETTEFGTFMEFKTISFCPIDLEGIKASMLTLEEKQWLNEYHKEVYQKLSPYLNDEEKHWLKQQTREI